MQQETRLVSIFRPKLYLPGCAAIAIVVLSSTPEKLAPNINPRNWRPEQIDGRTIRASVIRVHLKVEIFDIDPAISEG